MLLLLMPCCSFYFFPLEVTLNLKKMMSPSVTTYSYREGAMAVVCKAAHV